MGGMSGPLLELDASSLETAKNTPIESTMKTSPPTMAIPARELPLAALTPAFGSSTFGPSDPSLNNVPQ